MFHIERENVKDRQTNFFVCSDKLKPDEPIVDLFHASHSNKMALYVLADHVKSAQK